MARVWRRSDGTTRSPAFARLRSPLRSSNAAGPPPVIRASRSGRPTRGIVGGQRRRPRRAAKPPAARSLKGSSRPLRDHGGVLGAAYVDLLAGLGRGAGLDAVGVAPADPFLGTRHDLHERRAAGLHGGMSFTYRNPDRSTDPGLALAGAAALVVGARPYPAPRAPLRPGRSPRPHGRVAAYARHDHYGALRHALGAVANRLRRDGWQARVLVDDNALVDREAAYRGGARLVREERQPAAPAPRELVRAGSGGDDGAAPRQRPAGAGRLRRLPGMHRRLPDGRDRGPRGRGRPPLPGLAGAGPGSFPDEYRVALGDRLYGCDECQEVCPQNRRAGPGADDRNGSVDVLDLLAADDATLLARHGRWYVPDRDAAVLRRNALVVLGNTGDGGDPAVRATVRRYADDPDPMLAEHARWAAARLGCRDATAP